MQESEKRKSFVLYDGRAWTDVSTASVYTTAEDEDDALYISLYADDNGCGDGLWCEYDVEEKDGQQLLVNEKRRPDIMEHAARCIAKMNLSWEKVQQLKREGKLNTEES
jgi:hypothetical protein